MGLTYFKRYRMEIDLRRADSLPALAPGYRLIAWSPQHERTHAEVMFESFQQELDANIFPCLATPGGCRKLMRDLHRKAGFLPEATWLVEYVGVRHKPELCGTIQGMRATPRYGGIQNVGVTALHRGRGLGSALVMAALLGFRQMGLKRAYLEVTAQNDLAVKLYERLGFRRAKTVYKAVELAYS